MFAMSNRVAAVYTRLKENEGSRPIRREADGTRR